MILIYSSLSNDSIIHTHPDRKLGISCMKYFEGEGGVDRLFNEASLPHNEDIRGKGELLPDL